MLNTVKNYDKGTVAESVKYKPDSPIKGRISIEVINPDGSLSQEAEVENIVIPQHIMRRAQYPYIQSGIVKGGSVGPIPPLDPMLCLFLTDWDKPERADTPFILGKKLGRAFNGATVNNFTGNINTARSGLFTTTDGKAFARVVYEWTPDGAVGTFRSLFLSDDISQITSPPNRPDNVIMREDSERLDAVVAGVILLPVYDGTATGNLSYTVINNASRYIPETRELIAVGYTDSGVHASQPFFRKYTLGTFNMSTKTSAYAVLEDYNGAWVCTTTNSAVVSGYGPRKYTPGEAMGYIRHWYPRSDKKAFGILPMAFNDSNSLVTAYGLPKNSVKICMFNEAGKPMNDKVVDLNTAVLPTGEVFTYNLTIENTSPHQSIRMLDDKHIVMFGCFADAGAYGTKDKKLAGHIVIDMEQGKIVAVKNDTDAIYISSPFDLDYNISDVRGAAFQGSLMTLKAMAYRADGTTSTGSTTATYILDDEYNLHFISEENVRTSFGKTYGPYSITPRDPTFNSTAWGWNVSDQTTPPITHSLLPAPITKNDTQSMRITYDILIDNPITTPSYEDFVNFAASELKKG